MAMNPNSMVEQNRLNSKSETLLCMHSNYNDAKMTLFVKMTYSQNTNLYIFQVITKIMLH